MNTENLDGLISFHAINFPAPKEVKAAFRQGVEAYENGDLSTVERNAFLGAKKLANEGKVGSAWIKKGLDWWNTKGATATEDERAIYGGEKGRAWFEKCAGAATEEDKEVSSDHIFNYKAIKGKVKDVDDMKGRVAGYASTLNVWDSAKEMVMPGAFKRSIKEWGPSGKDRIKTLYQHNPAYLIGRPLELKEDETGLYHVTQLSKTSMGNDVLRLLADGVITEQSIGYTVLDAEPDIDDETRWKLNEVKLFEYSFVTWGANEYTPIHSVKSMNSETILRGMKELVSTADRALRSGDWETEEVPAMVGLFSKKLAFMIEQLEEHVVGEDNFGNAKSIVLPTAASTAESDKPADEPESVKETPKTEDEEILRAFKAASFTPDVTDVKLQDDLLQAFKSFQFLEEN